MYINICIFTASRYNTIFWISFINTIPFYLTNIYNRDVAISVAKSTKFWSQNFYHSVEQNRKKKEDMALVFSMSFSNSYRESVILQYVDPLYT